MQSGSTVIQENMSNLLSSGVISDDCFSMLSLCGIWKWGDREKTVTYWSSNPKYTIYSFIRPNYFHRFYWRNIKYLSTRGLTYFTSIGMAIRKCIPHKNGYTRCSNAGGWTAQRLSSYHDSQDRSKTMAGEQTKWRGQDSCTKWWMTPLGNFPLEGAFFWKLFIFTPVTGDGHSVTRVRT